ncbi:hypothetical protein [Halohasta litorea]|uniref:Major tropism determinant N-terminal domain-containing protein n=1 Tax=Halohasta litorea TaxID=869891 RepID=A0ABD6D5C2_9EURY|nr:hypothetical protein [Halohasta litorea]
MTENNDYNIPDQGATDWHTPLNDNFEKLDTDVEIRDVDANKGDYEPKSGAKYLATDTKRIYLGSGDAWEPFARLGGFSGQVYVQETEPDGQEGDIWFDTSEQ